jgi:hypothetical protein
VLKEILCSIFHSLTIYVKTDTLQFVLQVICNHRGIFTAYELGWPGFIADSTIFKESDMWQRHHKYFAEDEYILVHMVTENFTRLSSGLILHPTTQ